MMALLICVILAILYVSKLVSPHSAYSIQTGTPGFTVTGEILEAKPGEDKK